MEAALNLAIIILLATTAAAPLFMPHSNPDAARKIVSWIWMFFATIPLMSEIIHSLFDENSIGPGTIVFASLAVPVILPAFFLHKRPGKGLSFILAYAWGGVGIFGVVFLLALVGTPVLFIKMVVGGVPHKVFLTAVFMAVWSGSALFICASTINTLKKIKLALKQNAPPKNH